MIVVSTELLAALYMESALTRAAEAVMRCDPNWASPLIWRAHLPHYVTAAVHDGLITSEHARAIVAAAPDVFRGREFPAPLADNMEVALQSNCSAFVAPFASLAKGLGLLLVTTDEALLQTFPEMAVAPAVFVARFGSEPDASH